MEEKFYEKNINPSEKVNESNKKVPNLRIPIEVRESG